MVDAAGCRRNEPRAQSPRARATYPGHVGDLEEFRPTNGNFEILPNVRAIPAQGHSPGQITHLLSSGDRQLFVTADVSLLPALFAKNPDWQVNLDQDPAMAAETRRRIFERAVVDKAMIAGTHWFLPNVGTLSKDGNGYAFVAVET